jgi:hypothetical protein
MNYIPILVQGLAAINPILPLRFSCDKDKINFLNRNNIT